jgi:hypothetical protein
MSVSVHIQGKPFWRFKPLIAATAAVSFIQLHLAAPAYVHERPLFDEALGGGETHSAAAARDECNFSLELWH